MMQSTQQQGQQKQEENLLSYLIFKYIPYWPMFVMFAVALLIVGFLYLRYSHPKFEATATLIVKDEKKGYDDSKMMESLNLINTKKIIENELEVLQSRTLMDTVVKSLHLYAPVYEHGKVKATSAYLTSPVLIESANPDTLNESGKFYFSYNPTSRQVQFDTKETFQLSQFVQTPAGRLRFIPNPAYIAPSAVKPLYFKLVPVNAVAQQLLKNLNVAASSKLSTIINLKYRDEVPKKAEDVLNQLIKSYTASAINEKNGLARGTLSFVEERLNVVAKDLDSIERKIQQYKSGTNAIDISTQGQLFLQNVSENDQKMSDVNMQIAVLGQVENFVTSKGSEAGVVPSTLGVSDPALSQLLDKLNAAELEREKLKATVAENNPVMLSVTDQINKLKPGIVDNIRSQRQSLLASKNNINATNGRYNSMLQSIPAKERQLLEISREQAIKNGIYSFLLQKREESALSFSSNVSDSRIVDMAEASSTPVSPKPLIIYLVAIIAALAITIAVITVREFFNRKILFRQEIERSTAFPVISEIALEKEAGSVVIEKGKRTFIAEEFRKLRVSLPFLGLGNDRKKILVTSSIPGEGKSFIAINLAISLSLTGKRVALLDLDLNNSGIGDLFTGHDSTGIADYLEGRAAITKIIYPQARFEGLSFLPTGRLPEAPAELISNNRMTELMIYLQDHFDYIVMDTAPVVPVTDAYLLAEHTDATLFVVRHKYTPKTMIKRLDENNRINKLVNPAIVFNAVQPRGFFNRNYGYGYGYGYVYDNKPSKKKKILRGTA